MAQIYFGTSGWAYKAWKPDFYPEDLPQKKFLQYYASQLGAVEVNYTFRNRISEKTTASWLADTPETFRFTLKANQGITHFKRLKDAQESVRRFLDSIAGMHNSGRLGAVLLQLPPNLKADAELLDTFLSEWPRQLRSAFEFRHESWFAEEPLAVLKKHKAALCIAETDSLTTPETLTADFTYFRFRKPNYTAAECRRIAERIQSLAGMDVYAFFKHEESPEGALNALDVQKQLKKHAAAG
jgi:uncharacterized protein YecE (DUF72 family)